MHTASALSDDSFSITVGGREASVFDLFPGFDAHDRVGVVVTTPHGALGASLLYLAAVHAFYELQRGTSDRFWIYPDFYFFHIGARYGHHGSLDVWPDHKEVEVEADPERVLEAINDRAITRILVPDRPGASAPAQREALASYRRRIRSAFAYSPTGSARNADIVVRGDTVMEGWVSDVLDPPGLAERLGPGAEADAVRAHVDEVSPATRASIAKNREGLLTDGRTRETYRRISPDEALGRLEPLKPANRSP
jgi:hypothetical protein